MEVVGHHAECEEPERESALGIADQLEEALVVPRLNEDGGSIIAPVDQVVVPTGNEGTGCSWHRSSVLYSAALCMHRK